MTGNPARVRVLDDDRRRGLELEAATERTVEIQDVVVRKGLALQYHGIGQTRPPTLGGQRAAGVSVKRRLLMGVLAIAKLEDTLILERERAPAILPAARRR